MKFPHFPVKIGLFWGVGGVPELFFLLESSYFCYLGAHAKFYFNHFAEEYFYRKCLVVFALETAEEITGKVEAIELELLEKEELSLTEEQVQSILPEGLEGDDLEELRSHLCKPVLVYAFRNLDGDIDEGTFRFNQFILFSSL